MGAKAKVFVTLALAGACGVLALPSAAGAAPSGVTIHLRIGDQFKGFVFSPKPSQCAENRRVKLFRQKGKQPNPKRDVKVATTQASKRGNGKYRWIVDLRRPRPGNYYAKVPASAACQGDNSKTIRLSARPNTEIGETLFDSNRSLTFYYDAIGGVSPYHFQCRLDDQSYRRCGSYKKAYRHLSRGRHVFRVRAIGANGKRDRTPAQRGFHIPH